MRERLWRKFKTEKNYCTETVMKMIKMSKDEKILNGISLSTFEWFIAPEKKTLNRILNWIPSAFNSLTFRFDRLTFILIFRVALKTHIKNALTTLAPAIRFAIFDRFRFLFREQPQSHCMAGATGEKKSRFTIVHFTVDYSNELLFHVLRSLSGLSSFNKHFNCTITSLWV